MPVPPPSGLLARGAIRQPSELWRRTQTALEGRARLLPSSFALALSTVVLESPLAVGLIDGEAPIALAVVADGERGPGLIAGVRLTSGPELVALLTTGADAKFDADLRAAGGLTMLRARSRGGLLSLGSAGDCLLLGSSEALLGASGLFVARTVAPAIGAGESVELVAEHDALAGPLADAVGANLGELRARFQSADANDRRAHGGRSPDFGDPAPLITELGSLSDQGVALLRSASRARVTLSLEGAAILARAELVPDETGPLHELALGMQTGSLAPVLSLPDWVDAAVFTRSSGAARETPPLSGRIESVFGGRLANGDRERLRAFLGDIDRGVGRIRAAGLFDSGGVGVFAVGPDGDAGSLTRAMDSLPAISKIPAIAGPLRAIAGQAFFTRPLARAGSPARWVVRFAKPGRRVATAPPTETFGVAASSSGGRVAVVAAQGDPEPKLADLLASGPLATVGGDPAVVRAVARAGEGADGAVLVRVRGEEAAPRFATLVFGSDRKVTWAEVVMGEAAFRSLVQASIGQ